MKDHEEGIVRGVLAYQPVVRRAEFWKAFWFYYALNFIGLAVAMIFVFYFGVHFGEFLRDFRTELPDLTVWCLMLSNWVVNHWGWIAMVVLLAAWSLVPAYLFVRFEAQPWRRRWLAAMLAVVYLGGFLLMITGLLSPFRRLMWGVTGGV